MPALKQDSLDKICRLVGLPPMRVGEPGSSVPVEMFYGVARAFGVEVGGRMPEMGEAIAAAAGLPWEQRCDSRHTPSRGGSTVTAHGMERLAQAVVVLQAGPTSEARGAEVGQRYVEARGGVEGDKLLVRHDLALLDKATKAHAATQNELAGFLRAAGLDPRSPVSDEPLFDLAWGHAHGLAVCEVKTITTENARQQTRLAIGQLAEYRWRLEGVGPINLVIATNAPLPDAQRALCSSLEITTTLPASFAVDLNDLIAVPGPS